MWVPYSSSGQEQLFVMLPVEYQVCCFDGEVFGAGSFERLCDVCFAELKEFCRSHSMTLHMSGLTRTLLGFMRSSDYPTGKLCYILTRCSFSKMMSLSQCSTPPSAQKNGSFCPQKCNYLPASGILLLTCSSTFAQHIASKKKKICSTHCFCGWELASA